MPLELTYLLIEAAFFLILILNFFFSVKLRCGFYLKDSLDLGFRRFFAGVLLNCNAVVAAAVILKLKYFTLFIVVTLSCRLCSINSFFELIF